MIKQKYDCGFFYDNYKYRYDSMFRKYYKKLEDKYRYFLIVKPDINNSKLTYACRSNLSIEEILDKLKEMDFMEVEITDNRSKFPGVSKYRYIKLKDVQQIVKIYEDNQSKTLRFIDDTLIYMYYANYRKGIMSARMDNNITVYYYSYRISCRNDEITVHKGTPLSGGHYEKYNSDHKEMVEKVLKALMKDNISGFYDDMIQKIKTDFSIRI